MGYTHFDKIAAENGIAIGAAGSETVAIDSDGRIATGADDYDYIITMTSPTLGTSGTFVVAAPGIAGTIEKIYTVLNGAIITGKIGRAHV